ncbi:hypothetical protein EYF80_024598 [Liparis tanakae]|uniref:Uncharacterized protein n=1 Tax=Liparis tanakae TaxID=230148 RepID=A0A4Z2HHW4_9TELE|nr:hypothetical protein EYF80_024598 [Liparis tanakae]
MKRVRLRSTRDSLVRPLCLQPAAGAFLSQLRGTHGKPARCRLTLLFQCSLVTLLPSPTQQGGERGTPSQMLVLLQSIDGVWLQKAATVYALSSVDLGQGLSMLSLFDVVVGPVQWPIRHGGEGKGPASKSQALEQRRFRQLMM